MARPKILVTGASGKTGGAGFGQLIREERRKSDASQTALRALTRVELRAGAVA